MSADRDITSPAGAADGQEFRGRCAVVTGAASGIGAAIAGAFARLGASQLFLVDHNSEQLAVFADALRAATDAQVHAFAVDVSDAAAMAELAGLLRDEAQNGLDVIVTAAGILGPCVPIVDCPEEAWDELFAVNVRGTYLTVRHLLPVMRSRGGAIVTVASAAGLTGSLDLGPYGASKAAVVMMTRSLALQHAANEIRVNCVCPGSIETKMLEQALAGTSPGQSVDERRAAFLHRHPLGRFGQPEDVADAVAYLAGPRSGFLTGVALPVDGGRLA